MYKQIIIQKTGGNGSRKIKIRKEPRENKGREKGGKKNRNNKKS
jgi:hypothetical protein